MSTYNNLSNIRRAFTTPSQTGSTQTAPTTPQQPVIGYNPPAPAPRDWRWVWPVLSVVIVAVVVFAVLRAGLNPPTRRSAPPNVTPPVEAGARPQEDAPVILDTVTPAVETMRVSDQGVDQSASPSSPRYSPRGRPSRAPGATTRPPFGAWWGNRRYE